MSKGLITITNDMFSSPMEFFEEGQIIAAIMSLGGDNCKITDIVLSIDTGMILYGPGGAMGGLGTVGVMGPWGLI